MSTFPSPVAEDVPSGEEWLHKATPAQAEEYPFTFTAIPAASQDDQEQLPLHQAIKDANLPAVLALIRRLPPGSLVATSPDGYSPLHVIAAAAEPTGVHLDIALALINALPCDAFAATDEEGNTPLHIACAIGSLDMVRLLFNHCPEAVRVAKNVTQGATPLHLSIYQGTNARVNSFLISRLPPEALLLTDDDGNTPLQAAREEEDTETVELLTSYAAPSPHSFAGSSNTFQDSARTESTATSTARGERKVDCRANHDKDGLLATPRRAAAEKARKEKKWAVAKVWEDVINLIIRPRRHQYCIADLGPKKFQLQGKVFVREDVTVTNERGLNLECSWFMPHPVPDKLACVVTCHGNAGSRCFALDMIRHLLPCNISVFTFDFAGCGLSDGEYISLGYFEKMDLHAVIQYLRGTSRVTALGVWGRSMGAVTAIMYGAAHHADVAAICCDSPYASLYKVMVDLVKTRKKWIPEAAVRLATRQIRRSIKKRAQFDIKQLNTVECARHCSVPGILAHALSDDFILPAHHEELVHNYKGPFQAITFSGDHSSPRPSDFYAAVRTFFLVHLTPDSELAAGLCWAPTPAPIPAEDVPVVASNNLCADCTLQ